MLDHHRKLREPFGFDAEGVARLTVEGVEYRMQMALDPADDRIEVFVYLIEPVIRMTTSVALGVPDAEALRAVIVDDIVSQHDDLLAWAALVKR